MIGWLREKGIGVVGSGWDVRYCIAGVSACAFFSLLRCLSSAIMSHCDLIRITSCPDARMEKAWTSVSVAVPMNRGKNSCSSRISADKRFYIMFVVTPHLNGRDFGVNQHRKFRPLFLFGQ